MPADQAQRASPDALLSLAKKEGRGHLKIFLGAAPGVGKTYAMLGEAHRRLERGTDVVAAVVETHGRAKTAELIEGIEVIPPRFVLPGYHRAALADSELVCVGAVTGTRLVAA